MDVKQITAGMTLENKCKMCSGLDFWHLEGVEEAGIPPVMVTDGPCGIRKQADAADHLGINASVPAVSYPTGSCVASSFDDELLYKMGVTLANECQAEDIAVLLGPAANIKRSPLCGRNFEYFSEDPYLTGKLAASYIKGVQSGNVGTSLKHFACNNQETRRLTSDSVIDERTLREIYLAGFETAVKDGKPWTVMGSYNKINGTYATENKYLLTDILRDEWGFDGYVVSDWGAVNNRVAGLLAGMELEMPGGTSTDAQILEAVKNGTIPMSVLDTAVERILKVTAKYLESRNDSAVFDYESDHELARRAAAESMVLLKNDGILPLNKSQKIAFIGKFAEKPRFQGGGSSHVNCYKITGAVEAAKDLNVVYAQGYITDKDEIDERLIAEAVETAKNAEAAVLFIGITDQMESEGFDRKDLNIPKCQQKLVEEVCKVQKNVVTVVHCGAPIEMPWIGDVKGVLYAYLGGEAVGLAVTDILFGEVNPSGKLAESFPIRIEDSSAYLYYLGEGDNAEYREGIFVGYRYYDKKKTNLLFPFGYGLSYTTFDYSNIVLDKKEMADTDTLTVTADIENTGKVKGKEIVELYVANSACRVLRPIRELRGYCKVELDPGEKKKVTFTLNKRSFAYYNTEISDWYVPTGEYTIEIGKSSRELVLDDTVKVMSTTVIKKPFTLDSTLGEVMANPTGAQVVGQMMAQMPIANVDTENIGMDLGAMMYEIPLRAVLSFGGDVVTPEMIDGLIKMLNESL